MLSFFRCCWIFFFLYFLRMLSFCQLAYLQEISSSFLSQHKRILRVYSKQWKKLEENTTLTFCWTINPFFENSDWQNINIYSEKKRILEQSEKKEFSLFSYNVTLLRFVCKLLNDWICYGFQLNNIFLFFFCLRSVLILFSIFIYPANIREYVCLQHLRSNDKSRKALQELLATILGLFPTTALKREKILWITLLLFKRHSHTAKHNFLFVYGIRPNATQEFMNGYGIQ